MNEMPRNISILLMEMFPKFSHVDWIVLDDFHDESHISSCSDMFGHIASHVLAHVRERVLLSPRREGKVTGWLVVSLKPNESTEKRSV